MPALLNVRARANEGKTGVFDGERGNRNPGGIEHENRVKFGVKLEYTIHFRCNLIDFIWKMIKGSPTIFHYFYMIISPQGAVS